ncbi:mediator complex subunit [Saitoella coloradoensis]
MDAKKAALNGEHMIDDAPAISQPPLPPNPAEQPVPLRVLVQRLVRSGFAELREVVERYIVHISFLLNACLRTLHRLSQAPAYSHRPTLLPHLLTIRRHLLQLLILTQYAAKSSEPVSLLRSIDAYLEGHNLSFHHLIDFELGPLVKEAAALRTPPPDLEVALRVLKGLPTTNLGRETEGLVDPPPLTPADVKEGLDELNAQVRWRLGMDETLPMAWWTTQDKWIIHDGRVRFVSEETEGACGWWLELSLFQSHWFLANFGWTDLLEGNDDESDGKMGLPAPQFLEVEASMTRSGVFHSPQPLVSIYTFLSYLAAARRHDRLGRALGNLRWGGTPLHIHLTGPKLQDMRIEYWAGDKAAVEISMKEVEPSAEDIMVCEAEDKVVASSRIEVRRVWKREVGGEEVTLKCGEEAMDIIKAAVGLHVRYVVESIAETLRTDAGFTFEMREGKGSASGGPVIEIAVCEGVSVVISIDPFTGKKVLSGTIRPNFLRAAESGMNEPAKPVPSYNQVQTGPWANVVEALRNLRFEVVKDGLETRARFLGWEGHDIRALGLTGDDIIALGRAVHPACRAKWASWFSVDAAAKGWFIVAVMDRVEESGVGVGVTWVLARCAGVEGAWRVKNTELIPDVLAPSAVGEESRKRKRDEEPARPISGSQARGVPGLEFITRVKRYARLRKALLQAEDGLIARGVTYDVLGNSDSLREVKVHRVTMKAAAVEGLSMDESPSFENLFVDVLEDDRDGVNLVLQGRLKDKVVVPDLAPVERAEEDVKVVYDLDSGRVTLCVADSQDAGAALCKKWAAIAKSVNLVKQVLAKPSEYFKLIGFQLGWVRLGYQQGQWVDIGNEVQFGRDGTEGGANPHGFIKRFANIFSGDLEKLAMLLQLTHPLLTTLESIGNTAESDSTVSVALSPSLFRITYSEGPHGLEICFAPRSEADRTTTLLLRDAAMKTRIEKAKGERDYKEMVWLHDLWQQGVGANDGIKPLGRALQCRPEKGGNVLRLIHEKIIAVLRGGMVKQEPMV